MKRIQIVAATLAALLALSGGAFYLRTSSAQPKAAAAQPQALPVPVAVIEEHEVTTWDEFSGRLEAVERVDVRSRVAGQVKSVHFTEGALVKRDDLLVTIDPDPYAAEVDRAQAQVAAAQARVNYAKSEHQRARRLWDESAIARRELDERVNAEQEADANLRAAQAALQSARLNLGYTQVRAPVSGRVGRLEITVGNLVAAGPGAPVLTTLVSVNPIYASFDADEHVVLRTLQEGKREIPVEAETVTNGGRQLRGRLQLIDNQAKEFVEQGAKVVVSGRDQKTLTEVARELGPDVLAVRADVAHLADIEKLFAAVRAKFGRIDVLFVNAGIGKFSPIALFLASSDSSFLLGSEIVVDGGMSQP